MSLFYFLSLCFFSRPWRLHHLLSAIKKLLTRISFDRPPNMFWSETNTRHILRWACFFVSNLLYRCVIFFPKIIATNKIFQANKKRSFSFPSFSANCIILWLTWFIQKKPYIITLDALQTCKVNQVNLFKSLKCDH